MPPKTLLSLVGCACVLASPSLHVASAAEPYSLPASTPSPTPPPSADASGPRSTEMPLPGGGKVVLRSQEHFGSFCEELTYHPAQSKPVRLWNALPYELYHAPTLHPGRNGALALTGKDEVLAQGPWRFLTGSFNSHSAEFVVIGPGGQPDYWRFAPSPSARGWPLTDEAKLDDLNVAQLLQAKFTSERKLDFLWEDGTKARYEMFEKNAAGGTSTTLRTAVRTGL